MRDIIIGIVQLTAWLILDMRSSRSIVPTFGSVILAVDGVRIPLSVSKISFYGTCEISISCGNTTHINKAIAVEIPEGYPIIIDGSIY